MKLRTRLILFLIAFLSLTIITGIGFISLSLTLKEEIVILHDVNAFHKQDEQLKDAFTAYVSAISRYVNTGSENLKVVILKREENIKAILRDIEGSGRSPETVQRIKSNLISISDETSRLLKKEFTDKNLQKNYQRIMDFYRSVQDDLDRLHMESIRLIDGAIERGMDIQRNIFLNIIALFTVSIAAAGFLLLMLRRSIDRPFKKLLDATERISGGELTYRVELGRDEFGIIAERFYEIVDKLRLKLRTAELFLEVSRPVSGVDLKDYLDHTVLKISKGFDTLAEIYMLEPEEYRFKLFSTSHPELSRIKEILYHNIEFIKDSGVIWSNRIGTSEELRFIYDGIHESAIIAPLYSHDQLRGLLVLRRRHIDSFIKDDLYSSEVLSHILSSIIRNAELYSELQAGYERFRSLYEFGKAISGEVNISELLNKSCYEIWKVFNAPSLIWIEIEKGKELYFYPPDFFSQKELSAIKEGLVEPEAPYLSFPFQAKDYKGQLLLKPTRVFTERDIQLAHGIIPFLVIDIDKAMAFEQIVDRERETEESKRRMEILFDSVRGGIVTLDKEFRIVSINKYMEHWIEHPEVLVGRDSREVFHEIAPVCPHCVAAATFETGEINFMSQRVRAKDVFSYSELSSYPIKDRDGSVKEVIVFIQDVSERVLYQEELMGLYREVMQTKEYLESVIENTADAIVTSDLNGIVTSWNKGAERIYGFKVEEVIGKYLPFIPQGLYDIEREYTERIRRGEVLKDIETYRLRKDGSVIEVSLTLSPIKDAYGNIIGISGISRDITEKKRYERELAKRNQELSRLFFISSAMRSTLELDRLLRMILTAVTMSDGLGFNRAILFLVDEERGILKGAMGVGPSSPEEAWRVWSSLSMERKTLEDLLKEIESGPLRKDSLLDRLSLNIEIPLSEDTVLTRSVKEKRIFNITDVKTEPLSDPVLVQQLGTEAYAVVPLISRDRVIGLLWVDNLFNRRPITEDDIRFLTGFSNQVAAAIENARLFERVRLAEAELENIFESISDMIYITTADYTIKNINRAVLERLNKRCMEEGIERTWTKEAVIGKKCYEVFHGMDRPYENCPHHKTVIDKKAYVEEFEDPYLGITSLSSTSPLFDSTGGFLGTVHVVRDITELKRLREMLQASEKMAALGEVAAKVAHEIRNPLVSVGGFARRLEARLDGKLKEYASIITKEVNRLENILHDILSFVRGMGLAIEETDINSLLDDIVLLYREELNNRKIQVRKEYNTFLRLPVDAGRIKEAVINIFTNAIQAIERDGIITIITDKKNSEGVIIIKDTGPGINEKDLPNIFNPFFTTKAGGTGLGLAITKRIIDEHGGRIEVETVIGKGTSFKIFLPLFRGNQGGIL
ncbi:MAG: PAS domain S-box protein [Thermodesulfovibrionales bacterium]|nr:PAS domain S-box protein [Thermodesulfovibrionales bacterium]